MAMPSLASSALAAAPSRSVRRDLVGLTPWRMVTGIRKALAGEFLIIGLGDGSEEGDAAELINGYENLAIIMTLILSIYYPSYER